MYDYVPQTKLLDVEAPIFAYACMLTKYVGMPIFISIINVPDLNFQDL